MGTGTQHRVGAHPTRAAQGAVSCGASQVPGDGDKWEQLGESTQDHSLLMALLRVRAHPPGMDPELSPDQFVSWMESPVPQCVIPCASARAGTFLGASCTRTDPLRGEFPAAWPGLGSGCSPHSQGRAVSAENPQLTYAGPGLRLPAPLRVSVFQLPGRACVRTGSFPRLPGRGPPPSPGVTAGAMPAPAGTHWALQPRGSAL